MKTAKDEVRDLLEHLPENASFEDIQYHIYVRQKIDKGLEAERGGRILTQQEVERRISRWTEK
jgi:predicted transcriptional regulator